MNEVPTYSLYEAEQRGHAKVLWAIGDGTTTRFRVTVRNLHHYPIALRIDPGTTFAPHDRAFQEMAVLRPAVIALGPFETRAVWINTACLQARRRAPGPASPEQVQRRRNELRTLIRDYLAKEGLQVDVEAITEEAEDGIRTRLDDLQSMGKAMGYTPERIQAIYDELEDMRHRHPVITTMGYQLAPLDSKRAAWVACVSAALQNLDALIAEVADAAGQPYQALIQKYGYKGLIAALATAQDTLQTLQFGLFLTNFDSGLAHDVFANSDHHFQPLEAWRLTEFDDYNDPGGREKPRLSSLIAQYAIWAGTDDLGLDDCCRVIKRQGKDVSLMGAGVRSVLRRAVPLATHHGLSEGDIKRCLPRFAESRLRRFASKL